MFQKVSFVSTCVSECTSVANVRWREGILAIVKTHMENQRHTLGRLLEDCSGRVEIENKLSLQVPECIIYSNCVGDEFSDGTEFPETGIKVAPVLQLLCPPEQGPTPLIIMLHSLKPGLPENKIQKFTIVPESFGETNRPFRSASSTRE